MEEAASWLEKMSGRIEVEQLYPSWLIFTDGFRFSSSFNLMRGMLSTTVALILLLLVLPVLPLVILAIKLDSEGPILYRQKAGRTRGAGLHLLQVPHYATRCRGRHRADMGERR